MQFINMSTHEVSIEGKISTNNHGGVDVPQRNELVVDEEGSQNISEAVEEPPSKRSKIDKIPKTECGVQINEVNGKKLMLKASVQSEQ